MAKLFKKLLGVAAVGTAAAGALYYWKKNKVDPDEFEDDFEDDDFDLDDDLKPMADREYVSLNSASKAAGEASEEKPADAENKEAAENESKEDSASCDDKAENSANDEAAAKENTDVEAKPEDNTLTDDEKKNE